MAALLKEIDLVASFPPGDAPVETIYFGGGTPSLCTKKELEGILRGVRSAFPVSVDAEITLEVNPDDITEEKLGDWRAAGINRLSIGVQSFFEEDLRWMNRAHTAVQAIESLQLATRHFDNISMDLIYGSPALTDEKWKQNVERAISLGIPHLSCYALTVEPKTPLQKMILQHTSEGVDPDKQSAQFLLLMEWLKKAGYEHYEISNFARPGFRSRHNSAYWQGRPYLGLGPSAHSFDGKSRWWNIANNSAYIASIERGVIPFEKEDLTTTQRINEYIMISLRTSEGLDLSRIAELVNEDVSISPGIMKELLLKSGKYMKRGLMKSDGDRLQLTSEGRLLADGIAADLFADQ